jgi:hypothetical protein
MVVWLTGSYTLLRAVISHTFLYENASQRMQFSRAKRAGNTSTIILSCGSLIPSDVIYNMLSSRRRGKRLFTVQYGRGLQGIIVGSSMRRFNISDRSALTSADSCGQWTPPLLSQSETRRLSDHRDRRFSIQTQHPRSNGERHCIPVFV